MFTHDDPRLTAYALGEMTDADRAAFEAELQAADPAAKAAADAEIESIRSVAATLTGELREEANVAWAPRPCLSSPNENHERGAHATKSGRHVARWVLAAAAAVVVGGLAFSIFTPSLNRASDRSANLRQIGTGTALYANEIKSAQFGIDPSGAIGQSPATRRPHEVVITGGKDATPPPGHAKSEAEPLNGLLVYPSGWPDLSKQAAGQAAGDDRKQGYTWLGGEVKLKDTQLGKRSPGLAVAGDADGDGIADARLQPVVIGGAQAEVNKSVMDVTETGSFRSSVPEAEREKLSRQLAENTAESDKLSARLREFDTARGDAAARTEQPAAESYAAIHDNNFLDPHAAPLSTFGIDVDTASYANVRRYLESGQRPPADAVRIEELINYFPTSDAAPTDGRPFAVRMEVAECPWQPEHRLVRVAIKGQVIAKENRPPSNLVFLVDVSGSMNEPNKLPLVKRSLRKLVGQLGENDRVAIVVYAGNSGLALPSTNASDKTTILNAIDKLEAGGSTNGGQGIELAYSTAMEHLAKDAGSNRVILCTDGDFNVGVTDRGQLFNLIAEKAKAGVFLNVLGFGTGNTKDDTMEGLADKGNGQYGYIDSDREADKVFVEGLSGTLVTIAKDVKLQLEFNPGTVKAYRLIGYENRVMAAQDFNNDLKDSGDLGAGHNVVALYEIDPARGGAVGDPVKTEPALKYQPAPKLDDATRLVAPGANTTELLTLKLRYKRPDAPLEQGTSDLIETTLDDRADASIGAASNDMRFAASVAGFGMMLRESPNRGSCTWDLVKSLARGAIGDDKGGHRSEFLNLIEAAQNAR